MDTLNNKKELRKEYIGKRKAITQLEKQKLDDLLLIQTQRLALPPAEVLFNYLPMESMNEPNTFLFSHYFEFMMPGLQIAYPVTDVKQFTMQAYLTDEETEFEKRDFNLIEPVSDIIVDPKEIDIVIVPLLVADRQGYRVGYGKGIYDKFLAQCRSDVLKIGYSYFEPVESIIDIHKNDIPLDVLVCPNQIFNF